MKPLFQLLILLVVFGLAGCNEQANRAADSIDCSDPRPEMCTREYRPVCASRDSGIRCVTEPCPGTELKTYGNACDACADQSVISYNPGACDEESSE